MRNLPVDWLDNQLWQTLVLCVGLIMLCSSGDKPPPHLLGEAIVNAAIGAVLGFALWAFLFLILPQEFLGTVVGRPFEMDDGQLIVRYPWGMVVAVVALFALPIFGAMTFRSKS